MSSPSTEVPDSSAPVVRGQRFMVVLLLVILSIAGLAILGLRSSQHRRFAVSLSTVPSSPSASRVPLDQPLLLRVDHSSPRSRSLVSLAVLLDGDGNPLSPVLPMPELPGPKGRPIPQLEFPPLGKRPARGLVSGMVMRVRQDTPEVRARLAEAMEVGKPKSGQLARVFTRTIVTCRELDGHAEQAQREVR